MDSLLVPGLLSIVGALVAIVGALVVCFWKSLRQQIQRLEDNLRSDIKSLNDRIDRHLEMHSTNQGNDILKPFSVPSNPRNSDLFKGR